MQTKLVIFDFDGTLSDTKQHILNCGQKVIDKFNLRQPSKEEIEAMNGGVFSNVMLSLGATNDMLSDMKNYYKEVFLDDVSDITLYDGVFDTLTKLKKNGIKLAVATNRHRNILVPLLKHLKIFDLFDSIACESDVKNKKPHPEMVNLILNELNIKSEDSLVVGDTYYDILLGKNSSIKTCLVDYDNKGYSDEPKPDYIINKFKEIFDVAFSNNLIK